MKRLDNLEVNASIQKDEDLFEGLTVDVKDRVNLLQNWMLCKSGNDCSQTNIWE